MSQYLPVEQLGSEPDVDAVRAWAGAEPLRDLVRAFGGNPDDIYAGDDVIGWLIRLDEFSDRWDSRRGAERNVAGALEFTDGQLTVVGEVSKALGLTGGHLPEKDHYDHILMLGGLVRACVTRPAYAAEILRSGRVRAGTITALGGHRPFRGDEFELARLVRLTGISDEFAALDAGTRRAFGLGEPVSEDGVSEQLGNAAWTIRTYHSPDGLTVRVAAAPSSDPVVRRANTGDTYDWFARNVAAVVTGDRVLVVTTAIYVPAQHAAAIRMLGLPFGVKVETVGIQPGQVIPELDQQFTPSNYLQEIRSTIRSLRDLAAALGRQ